MARGYARPYAPNYMESWTQWFREQQEARGTIEQFAREADISVRMVGAYRAGTIPRRREQLAKIEAVLGEAGPLPGSRREGMQSLAERLAEVERRLAELEATVAGKTRVLRDPAISVGPVGEALAGLEAEPGSEQPPAPKSRHRRRPAE